MKIIFITSFLMFTSCASTDFIRLTERPLKPISEDKCRVQVLTQKPKDQKFIEVALITSGGTQLTGVDQLKRTTSIEACRLGANAVVIGDFKTGAFKGKSKLQVLAIRLID